MAAAILQSTVQPAKCPGTTVAGTESSLYHIENPKCMEAHCLNRHGCDR